MESEEGSNEGIGKGALILKAKSNLMQILILKLGEYLKVTEGDLGQTIINSISQ
jgi:hypothetical protein